LMTSSNFVGCSTGAPQNCHAGTPRRNRFRAAQKRGLLVAVSNGPGWTKDMSSIDQRPLIQTARHLPYLSSPWWKSLR
jgi:hypothetical protein